MKKIFIFIFLCLFFISTENVLAADGYKKLKSCRYLSETEETLRMELNIYSIVDGKTNKVKNYAATAKLLDDFKGKDEGSWWNVDNYNDEQECPPYLIYKKRVAIKVSFSNDGKVEKENKDYVLKLDTDVEEILGTIESEKNCVLKEMKCVYGYGNYLTITYEQGAFVAKTPLLATFNDLDLKNLVTSDGKYFCPPIAWVVTDVFAGTDKVYLTKPDENIVEKSTLLDLNKDPSYISCDEKNNVTVGQTCAYYREDAISDSTYVNITGYSDGTYNYALEGIKLNVSLDISKNKLQSSCDNLNVLYTDCPILGENVACTITDDYNKLDNPVKLTLNNSIKTGDETREQLGVITGDEYQKLMCEIKSYLQYNNVDISSLPQIDRHGTKLSGLSCSDSCATNDCSNNSDYLLKQTFSKVNSYCSEKIFRLYSLGTMNSNTMRDRMYECTYYNRFYSAGAELGLFDSGLPHCELVSSDFIDLLKEILDLIKIIGPILAVGLGTLDFIKAIVATDAAKETKTAFNRFLKRIIAAALLFLVPLILAFLMDTVLENDSNYNKDNPFCGVVEWGK